MALEYGPFNGLENAWDAYDFADFFKLFFGNGVFPNPSNNLQILSHENMQTKVSVGVGFIQGHKIKNTSEFVLQHDIADGVLKRIDRVVMRANFLENKGEIIVKRGTPASSPVAPTLVRDTDYYELALADVLINNGATAITQANITDQRLNTAVCGVVATNITQLDTTTLFNQYQSWFSQFSVDKQAEFQQWIDDLTALLDGDVAGNLLAQITQLTNQFNSHVGLNASLSQSGHVQLNDSVTSTSTTQAATANAVKQAYDRAEAAFQAGNSRKSETVDALLQVDDSLPISDSSNWATVIGAIGSISTGKKWASGTVTSSNTTQTFTYAYGSGVKTKYSVNVSGLTFTPTRIIINSLTSDDISILLIDGFLTPNLVICVPSITTGTSGTATIDYFKGSTSPANVSATNFNLPVNLQNHNYKWIAFG